MQSQYTGTQQRKKDRLKSRKFSRDEPYDRATEAMLANSSLSGGRKLSLQQGTLIQAQPNSLKQDSTMNFQQPPSTTTMNTVPATNPGYTTVPTTSAGYTTAPQNFVQQGFIPNNAGNYPLNYGTQNFVQQGYPTNVSGMPMNYGTEGLNQQGYVTYTSGNMSKNFSTDPLNQQSYATNSTSSLPMNYGTGEGFVQQGFVQQPSSNMPMSYGQEVYTQQGYTETTSSNMPTNYSTEGYTQQGFIDNTTGNMPATYSTGETYTQQGDVIDNSSQPQMNYGTEGLAQPQYTTETITITEGLTQPNYVASTGEEDIVEQPFIGEPGTEGHPQKPYESTTSTEGLLAHQTAISNTNQILPQEIVLNPNNDALPQESNLASALPVDSNPEYLNQQIITNNVQQEFVQPGLVGTGVATGPIIEANTTSLNMTQPALDTGFIADQTIVDVTKPTAESVPATKTDPNAGGVFTFKPLEGKFPKDKDMIGKMDPYCKIQIGMHSGKTAVAKNQGVHPVWNDVITLQKKHNEQFAKLKIRDHDKLLNQVIGETKIPLGEIATRGKINQWYPIYNKEQLTGEVLMEISFQPKTIAK